MMIMPFVSPYFPETGGDPYFSNVSLLLHCNGTDGSTTFTDSSSFGHTVTANGNAQIDTAQSKFGGASGLFDGSGDYIRVANSADMAPGSSDFTIELQFRASSYSATPQLIGLGNQYISNNAASGLRLIVNSDGTGFILLANTSGTSWTVNYSVTLGTPLAVDQWYHVALTRSGTALKIYLDGVEVGSTTVSGTIKNGGLHLIGAFSLYPSYTAFFNGWIDEVRYTKGVVRYTSSFTPPTAEFPDS